MAEIFNLLTIEKRVHIVWRVFEKIFKNNIEVTGPNKAHLKFYLTITFWI